MCTCERDSWRNRISVISEGIPGQRCSRKEKRPRPRPAPRASGQPCFQLTPLPPTPPPTFVAGCYPTQRPPPPIAQRQRLHTYAPRAARFPGARFPGAGATQGGVPPGRLASHGAFLHLLNHLLPHTHPVTAAAGTKLGYHCEHCLHSPPPLSRTLQCPREGAKAVWRPGTAR